LVYRVFGFRASCFVYACKSGYLKKQISKELV
jgi:hypothetical protein